MTLKEAQQELQKSRDRAEQEEGGSHAILIAKATGMVTAYDHALTLLERLSEQKAEPETAPPAPANNARELEMNLRTSDRARGVFETDISDQV